MSRLHVPLINKVLVCQFLNIDGVHSIVERFHKSEISHGKVNLEYSFICKEE